MLVETRNKTILLVEDNRGDIRLIQEALKKTAAQCKVVIARDGMEAMEYLRQDGEFAGAVRPDLILLDLNLPKK
ncbi:MAG TPA: response regulator, partial [Cyanobacteria bacterium UBA8553]|nr:response regulator [Cyanobacteria bacterium UBA8553]